MLEEKYLRYQVTYRQQHVIIVRFLYEDPINYEFKNELLIWSVKNKISL